MAEIEFKYNGNIILIQCDENENMKEIYKRFLNKTQLEKDNLYFIYGGKNLENSEELNFNQIANSIDKERKKMNILVNKNNNDNKNEYLENKLIKSTDIICPDCGENIKIKIANYKISLYDCKNKHKKNNLLLDKYEKTQYIDLSQIICNECKKTNKNETFNHEFYKCFECNKNICPLCKLKHPKNHNIINYDKIKYICGKHNEIFSKYCKDCKLNICALCEDEHLEHDCIYIVKIMKKKEDLLKKLDELRKYIDIVNKDIEEIIEKLNKTKEYYEKYYEMEKYMINNYDIKNRNYEILFNLNEITNNNDIIVNDIKEIINKDNIKDKVNNILNIYNKINLENEIRLTIKIDKNDINKDIYFLDNSDGKYWLGGDQEEHHHDFLKELNESNVELFINNEKYKYNKYFTPEKEGIYSIRIKFKIKMKDCSFMFFLCKNIINYDFSSFDISNVENMNFMFAGCNSLTNLNFDLSNFETRNSIEMKGMFSLCENIANIDLSSFDINICNIEQIFNECDKLKQIKINKNSYKSIDIIKKELPPCRNPEIDYQIINYTLYYIVKR